MQRWWWSPAASAQVVTTAARFVCVSLSFCAKLCDARNNEAVGAPRVQTQPFRNSYSQCRYNSRQSKQHLQLTVLSSLFNSSTLPDASTKHSMELTTGKYDNSSYNPSPVMMQLAREPAQPILPRQVQHRAAPKTRRKRVPLQSSLTGGLLQQQ
jgi:hypothetical protein